MVGLANLGDAEGFEFYLPGLDPVLLISDSGLLLSSNIASTKPLALEFPVLVSLEIPPAITVVNAH